MCTHPIQISRRSKVIGQVKNYVVPCGVCEECRSFKRQEFAALSIHQAIVSGSLYFFTLTYNDEHLPIAISDGEKVIGFQYGSCSWSASGTFNNSSFISPDGSYIYTCSLRREDVKNWLKQFRQEWKRSHGSYPDFKYCFFGELGEKHGRPHYHGLIYGASSAMAHALDNLWKKRFGFSYCVPSDYRKFSLEEVGNVSGYVSKYISKGVSSRFSHLLSYIEKPRRICSKNFGAFSLEELKQLRSYYDGCDIRYLPKDLFCQEVLKRRSSLTVNGRSFPIPISLKQKLFYDESASSNDRLIERDGSLIDPKLRSYEKDGLVPCKARRSPVSLMVADFARSQFDYNLSEQLRKSSGEDSKQVHRRVIRETLQIEKASSQFREEIEKSHNINNLKHQKDGQ